MMERAPSHLQGPASDPDKIVAEYQAAIEAVRRRTKELQAMRQAHQARSPSSQDSVGERR